MIQLYIHEMNYWKNVFLLIFFFALFFDQASAQNYVDSIEQIRLQKEAELKSKKESPLTKSDRKQFEHLSYFAVNSDYNLNAVYQRIDNGGLYNMLTSSGAVKQFQKHGIFIFQVGGHLDTLYAYMRMYPSGYRPTENPYLFIPFKDRTSGNETYGGGRYMDTPVYEHGQRLKLDFNMVYNPYCAYGDGFSCPIPPDENFVDFEIRAGEKTYVNQHKP